jgi:hypothetical protein
MSVLQSFLLPLEVGLTAVEAGLTSAQGLELTPEGDFVQLLPLLQQPLQLFHLPRPLVDLACAHSKVLLRLDDGTGPGLNRIIQLLHIGKGLLGVDVKLDDGLHLQVETMLPGPRHRPLGHCRPLEHASPQLEAPTLVSKVLTFAVQDALRLRQGLVSHAHGFTHGDVTRRVRGGMPLYHLHSLIGGSPRGRDRAGHR